MKALGIFRETVLAGKPGSDERILRLTGQELTEKGFQVELKHPQELRGDEGAGLVFTMARKEKTRKKIKKIQENGALTVNTPDSVKTSLNRELSYQLLEKTGARIPETRIVKLSELNEECLFDRTVLKRADRHEQWFIIKDNQELEKARDFYRDKNAERIAVQKFIEGEHVKYYAIGEKVILAPKTREAEKIRNQAILGGKALDLEVYGGDFILTDRPYLVDVNDWPSFGSIKGYSQEEAAKSIADYMAQKVIGYV